MSFNDVLNIIFTEKNISDIEDLNRYCGPEGRKKLYYEVKRMIPTKWASIKNPEASVRYYYELRLRGFKIYTAYRQ